MFLCIVIFVAVLIGLAIVLGAVLGTFVRPGGSSSSKTSPSPSVTEVPAGTTPTPTQMGGGETPVPTSKGHIHALAVTGWDVPGAEGYSTSWLFSQDADGWLSRHTFNSSTGNWTRVSNFARAKEGTPLAAVVMDTSWYGGQEVCYSKKSNTPMYFLVDILL